MRFHAQPPSARRPSCEDLVHASGPSTALRDRRSAGRTRATEVRIDGDAATAVIIDPCGEVEGEEERFELGRAVPYSGNPADEPAPGGEVQGLLYANLG